MPEDIIIVDAEFEAEANRVSVESTALEKTITDLSKKLTTISTTNLTDGSISENFKVFVDLVSDMSGKLSEICEKEKTLITNMIGEIEATDFYSYDY